MDQTALVRLRLDPGNVEPASQAAARSLERVGHAGEVSARRTAQAMRQLPAQLSDVASQLAGGQNPLLVLVQQGGQVAYSFGGIRAAASALLAGITPLTVSLGAVGVAAIGAGVAAAQGAIQTIKLRDTLALTGNAAGLTEDRISAMAEAVSAASGQTVGAVREIALGLAATGKTTAGVIASQALAIARIADLSGQSAEQVTQRFAAQLAAPARFAAELNRTYNFLSVAQFERIQKLDAEGKKAEAAAETNAILTGKLSGQRLALGYLEQALDAASKKWSQFWEAAKGLGRDAGPLQRLQETRKEIQTILDASGGKEPAAGTYSSGRIQALRAQAMFLAELAKQQRAEADEAAARALRVQAGIDASIDEEERRKKARAEVPYAIRDPRADQKQQFLRSEKEVYAQLAEEERKLREEFAKDPLGAFLTDQLNAQQRRDEQRLQAQEDFLQALRDTNARGAVELLADERERADALVKLDRETAERRLQALGFTGDALRQAQALLDTSDAQRFKANEVEAARTARLAGESTYGDVRDALAAAFRDTRNPVRAFADALGNAVYTRLTARIADALATALVGSDGSGGLLGTALQFLGSLAGPGYSVGVPAYPGGGITGGVELPPDLRGGGGYAPSAPLGMAARSAALGSSVPGKLGGRGAAPRGGMTVVQNITYNVAAGVSPAMLAAAIDSSGNAQHARAARELVRGGDLRRAVEAY